MPRRRLRTFILITGTSLCVLIAAAFVVSARWLVALDIPGGPCLYVQAGHFGMAFEDLYFRVWHADTHSAGVWWWRWALSPHAVFPLWFAFAAVAFPTLLVWRFWPNPIKPGHCRCGYDLTGLPEPRCPECGQPFEGFIAYLFP